MLQLFYHAIQKAVSLYLESRGDPTAQSTIRAQEVRPLVGMNKESPIDSSTILPGLTSFDDLLLNPFPLRDFYTRI